MHPVHPETSWRPEHLPFDVDAPSLASPTATALLEASSLVSPAAAFADARRFLGLERVALPEFLGILAGYADKHDGSVTQAGLTAALQAVYELGHRRLAARAETSDAAARRLAASTDHLIELVDHVYALFEEPLEGYSRPARRGGVDFVRVSPARRLGGF